MKTVETIDVVMNGDFVDGSGVKVLTIAEGAGKAELVRAIATLDIPKTDIHIGSFKREVEEDYKFGEATNTVVPPSLETLAVGFKITDRCGGKGVICRVYDDANMPVNLSTGERAEVLVDDYSGLRFANLYSGNSPPIYKPYPDIIDEFTHKRDVKRFKVKQHNAEYEAKQNKGI